ncbi:MAG: SulP family inorganic anion transporter [Sporichthyaceae bacterium]
MTAHDGGPGGGGTVSARGGPPFARWARGYRRENLRPDVVAGLTVGVLLIPQAMAYAALAGMPPQAGLYAAIVSLPVYALLGTSNFISVAPVAIDSLLVAATIGPIADGDVGVYVAGAGLLAVLTGLLQLAFGALRLGALVNLLSAPVIAGFTAGAALTIAASQTKDLLRLDLSGAPTTFLDVTRRVVPALNTAHALTAVLAAAALVALVLLRRSAPKVPGALIVVALATVAVAALDLDADGVRTLGHVPAGLPAPRLPSTDLDLVTTLLPAALTLAVISYVESIGTAKTFAARARQRVHPDTELAAVGASNVAAGLFGGLCVAGGFSRGAVNVRAGARTQLSGLVATGVLMVAVTVGTPLFVDLPRAVLAATILLAVVSLVDLPTARRMLRMRRSDGLAWAVAFVATLVFGVALGLGIGVAFALVVFLARTSRPNLVEVGRVSGTAHYRHVDRWETHVDARIALLRLDGPLFFADAAFVESRVHEVVSARPALRHVVLDASAIGDIDATGADLILALDRALAEGGVALHLATVRGPVRDVLAAAGLWEPMVAAGRIHATICDAVRTAVGPVSPLLVAGADEVAPHAPV